MVNILPESVDLPLIGRFGFKSGRDTDKFEGIKYRLSKEGNPILEENNIGYLEVRVDMKMDVGTHTIFVGHVTDGGILEDAEPLTYAVYHLTKKGKAPKTAPTYIKE